MPPGNQVSRLSRNGASPTIQFVTTVEELSQDPTITRLLGACPGLIAECDRELAYGGDSPSPYAQASALAGALTRAYQLGETGCFDHLFAEIEKLVVDPDQTIRELVVVGVLEDLQNEMLHEQLDFDGLDIWMGPETSQAWRELVMFWKDIEAKKASGELPPGPVDSGLPDVKNPELKRMLRRNYRPPK